MTRPRVVILRGHHAHAIELRAWDSLLDRFDVTVVATSRCARYVQDLRAEVRVLRTRREWFPPGRLGDLGVAAIGDGYRSLAGVLEGADIVHSVELGPWFSAQPAALREQLGFRLALTVWETIPLLDGYRTTRAARNRRRTLEATDLFLPTTDRAHRCLLLEGAPPERIQTCYPGIDAARFRSTGSQRGADGPLILSPGRLVWEKGHQDVLRAVAVLARGLVRRPDGSVVRPRLVLVGVGPEEARLRRHATELGIGELVDFRLGVPYAEMPALFASADCMVLASLPTRTWEEQFGLVIAEALTAGTPVAASRSGAIPEVVGSGGLLFDPGDWHGLAQLLAAGPLAHATAAGGEVAEEYSTESFAARIGAAYERLLAS